VYVRRPNGWIGLGLKLGTGIRLEKKEFDCLLREELRLKGVAFSTGVTLKMTRLNRFGTERIGTGKMPSLDAAYQKRCEAARTGRGKRGERLLVW